MEKHHGQIVERIVRRSNMSLSELSKHMGVNRRSVYNWFNLPRIKPEILYRLGHVIEHDFSHEFPECFCSDDFKKGSGRVAPSSDGDVSVHLTDEEFWKDKYIRLLEKLNESMVAQRSVNA